MKTLCCACLCWATLVCADEGDGFARQCARLAADARVEVRFEEGVVTRDDRLGVAELQHLARGVPSPYHHVLGLTRAEPAVTLVPTATVLAEAQGRVCAVPGVTLTLGFAWLQVDLARELRDPCRRAVVAAHEEEHVAVWRHHFRAGARLLRPYLQGQLGQAAVFGSAAEAREVVRQRVDGLVGPLLRGLREGIDAAQRAIDSPGSYQIVDSRMRACPTASAAGRNGSPRRGGGTRPPTQGCRDCSRRGCGCRGSGTRFPRPAAGASPAPPPPGAGPAGPG